MRVRILLSFVTGIVCVWVMLYIYPRSGKLLLKSVPGNVSAETQDEEKFLVESNEEELVTKQRDNLPSKIKSDCKTVVRASQKSQKVDPRIWSKVKYLLFFIGHFRSGTSLIGSLLDAHPNIVLAHEYGTLGRWEKWSKEQKTRDYFFQELFSKSQRDSRGAGVRSPWRHCYVDQYAFAIPTQWQGKFDKNIKIIGDKQSEQVVSILLSRPEGTLPEIQKVVKIPFKFIYIVRNPFDVAATKMIRKYSPKLNHEERKELYNNPLNYSKKWQVQEVKRLASLIHGAVKLTNRFGNDVIAIHSEDMITNPVQELKKICTFFDVKCSQDYLDDCAHIVYANPSKTRNMIIWDEEAKQILTNITKNVSYFKKYSFDERLK